MVLVHTLNDPRLATLGKRIQCLGGEREGGGRERGGERGREGGREGGRERGREREGGREGGGE